MRNKCRMKQEDLCEQGTNFLFRHASPSASIRRPFRANVVFPKACMFDMESRLASLLTFAYLTFTRATLRRILAPCVNINVFSQDRLSAELWQKAPGIWLSRGLGSFAPVVLTCTNIPDPSPLGNSQVSPIHVIVSVQQHIPCRDIQILTRRTSPL